MQDWKDALGSLLNSAELSREKESGNTAEHIAENPQPGIMKQSRIKIFYEKKGRAGKPATILEGFTPELSDTEIGEIAGKLKKRLGCGGSSRGGEILLQGDRRESVRPLLEELGFKV